MTLQRNRGLRISRDKFFAQLQYAQTILATSSLTLPEVDDFVWRLLEAENMRSGDQQDYGVADIPVLYAAGISRATPSMLEYTVAQLHAAGGVPDVCAFLSSAAEDIRAAS